LTIWDWLTLAVLLGARVLWQLRPNLVTCVAFWTVALFVGLLPWSTTWSQFVLGAGILSNAVVTLANGGFMPVASHRKLRGSARSLWVQRESGQKLLFLADNFGTSSIRFSVGDALLLAGILLAAFGQ
jgi:hypothetical protein